MRITSLLRSAAVLALAAVAGLAGVSGTWALWNASASSGAGTVQSANLVVTVDGAEMIVNDTTATVALADPSAALMPEAPVYASLTVTNATDASSDFTLRTTLGTPRVTSANSALASALVVRSAPMPASGGCASAAYPAGTAPEPTTADLARGGAQQFCLRLALPPKAPEALTSSAATVTVPVHVEQIR